MRSFASAPPRGRLSCSRCPTSSRILASTSQPTHGPARTRPSHRPRSWRAPPGSATAAPDAGSRTAASANSSLLAFSRDAERSRPTRTAQKSRSNVTSPLVTRRLPPRAVDQGERESRHRPPDRNSRIVCWYGGIFDAAHQRRPVPFGQCLGCNPLSAGVAFSLSESGVGGHAARVYWSSRALERSWAAVASSENKLRRSG
jgi:hypothetical protein